MHHRVAVLYDIHGNVDALRAVLSEVLTETADAVVVGGDFLYGPEPLEVLNTLHSIRLPMYVIRGNTEVEIMNAYDGLLTSAASKSGISQWCAKRLNDEQITWLKGLPFDVRIDIDGIGEVLFVHGSPRSEWEGMRVDDPDAAIQDMLHGVSQRVVVCGHTHVQFIRTVGGTQIVNPGSVGWSHHRRGACWAWLGPAVEFRCTPYDIEATAARIRNSSMPRRGEFVHDILHAEEPKE